MIFIAEVKTQSPFGFRSDKTWDELFLIARDNADWLSIHTDARWGGSFDLITKARGMTSKPILAKGIHARDEDIVRALAHGATYVLVVGRVPAEDLVEHCLLEPLSVEQLLQFPPDAKIVWNARNLIDGGAKSEKFSDIRKLWKGWLCQASHIKKPSDVNPAADAFLIGEALSQFVDLDKN